MSGRPRGPHAAPESPPESCTSLGLSDPPLHSQTSCWRLMLSWQMSGTSPQPGVGDEKIWSLKQVQCTWYYLRFVKMLQLYLKQNHFPTGCSTSIFTFLKCSWASRSFFLRAVELDSSWFQRFIKAAWRASMAFDWTCWAASSWSLRAVMLVIPSCWKAWRPASNVSCRQTQTRFCKRENLTSTKETLFQRMEYLLG